MKKIVAESLYEFEKINYNIDAELNEFKLSDVGKAIKGAFTGESGKIALESFFKEIEGKEDVDDKVLTDTFDKVYGYTYSKNPNLKGALQKLPLETKYSLMKASNDAMKANTKLNQPIVVVDPTTKKVKAGAITVGAATQPGRTAAQ